ncbi:MAG: glycerophosphodiester phosphodiesterase family protein [Gemmataceae bacterium]
MSNRDLVDFLLSPAGLLYAAVFAVVTVAALLIEQAGILALAATSGPAPAALRAALRGVPRLVTLGGVKVVLLAVTAVPFVALAGATYVVFLSWHDINFYLAERPPAFWLAATIGGALLLAAGGVGVWLLVRWSLALPIVLFERLSAAAALRASRDRVRGAGWAVGRILVGWHLVAWLAGAAGGRAACRRRALLGDADERSVLWPVALLAAQAGLIAAVSFVTVVGQALLTRQIYLARSEEAAVPATDEQVRNRRSVRVLTAVGLAVAVAPLAVWLDLRSHLAVAPPARVTAHRGHSRAAPENTLSAVRAAIDSGADYAEIDVQLTADGSVVLLHDRDLKRVGGDPRTLTDLSLDQLKRLDVGRWFGPAFAGERVPTLAEVIDLARGKIRLNIEMKAYGNDLPLAVAVAGVVCDKQFEDDCLVTSFSLTALTEAKRRDPRLRTGLIVARGLGDLSRLDVEALSVQADWVSDDLVRAAHRRGQEVHVWTVNDARQAARLLKRGADNLITDDPDLLIPVRDQWAAVSGPERLVLAARLLLGLSP